MQRKACIFLLLMFVAGCSEQATLPPLATGSVILAFGDSLTEGRGAQAGQSYPEVLAAMSNIQIINGGISGEVSAAGLARLPALLDEHQPDLLILCHGGNDLLRKLSVSAAEQNLRDMIALAESRNIPVVLLGVPNPTIFLSTAGWYNDIAESTNVVYVPDIIADVLGDRDLRSDAAHPNATGYRLIAEAVHESLEDAGALN